VSVDREGDGEKVGREVRGRKMDRNEEKEQNMRDYKRK
jgi:hypothetical protein